MGNLVMLDEVSFGKHLQIYLGEIPFLVIGDGDSSSRHNEIFERFLKQKNIPFKRELLQGPNFGPTKIGEGYKLVGAGRAEIYVDRIELYGRSDSYGINSDEKHAREISDLLKTQE